MPKFTKAGGTRTRAAIDNPNVERGSWSLAEFAARHNLSTSKVYADAKAGTLPVGRPGGTGPARVTREQELAWLHGAASGTHEAA